MINLGLRSVILTGLLDRDDVVEHPFGLLQPNIIYVKFSNVAYMLHHCIWDSRKSIFVLVLSDVNFSCQFLSFQKCICKSWSLIDN